MFNRPEGTLHKSKQTQNYLPIRLINIFLVKKNNWIRFLFKLFLHIYTSQLPSIIKRVGA